jgi:hypothetical protein
MAGCPGKDEPGLLDALEILSGFMLQLSACLPRQAIFAAFPDQRSWSRNAAPLSALRNRAGLSWLQRGAAAFSSGGLFTVASSCKACRKKV